MNEPDRTAEAEFEAELEVFRNEVEAATQFFHAERTFMRWRLNTKRCTNF